ncbi:MAG: 4-hydroxy-tetrahydrodipicolinate reductase [Bacteroidota bacterium]
MNIALIGYGKMGKTIEKLGLEQGLSFPLIIDENNPGDLNATRLKEIDVAVEFTVPEAAPENILSCLEYGIPVVSGTTGWNDRFGEIEAFCNQRGGSLFYASNFSIGVNILFAMNQQLARIMNQFPAYRASMKETHHIHKLDAPSGTAISLAQQIIKENDRIEEWELMGSDSGSDSLKIEAIREGEVKGIHTISYESDVDFISLGHHAKSRDAFVAGALLAVQFIRKKKGVYGMEDLLNL